MLAPPYGYMPAPMPKEHGGSGWTLVPDPDAVKVIERIVRELLEGVTVSAIAVGLNADSIPSPRDHWAVKKGRDKGGRTGGVKGLVKDAFLWSPSVITRMLRNEALLGWKMHRGKPVRDDQGNPIMATAESIMTREEFDRIGAVLDERSINNGDRTDTDALLLRVIHCDSCGARMYLNKQEGKQRPTYKCNPYARGSKCEKSANIRGIGPTTTLKPSSCGWSVPSRQPMWSSSPGTTPNRSCTPRARSSPFTRRRKASRSPRVRLPSGRSAMTRWTCVWGTWNPWRSGRNSGS